MTRVDLNCDMGELAEAVADGTQETLMRCVSSVNIACGGHAGDLAMMGATIEQALRLNVSIGAHPGYEDRVNFGRIDLPLEPDEIAKSMERQVRALEEVAKRCGAGIAHVKPHGALYNRAARNRETARAIAAGVRRWRSEVTLVGLAGSRMLEEFRGAGFTVAAEAFADRRYESDGTLRSRKFADALLHSPAQAADQALRIAQQGSVVASDGSVVSIAAQTICVHGDTAGAVQIARAVREALEQSTIRIIALTA